MEADLKGGQEGAACRLKQNGACCLGIAGIPLICNDEDFSLVPPVLGLWVIARGSSGSGCGRSGFRVRRDRRRLGK